MMASVVSWINELGVDVQHIPGGCTGLCQPLDVGVTKPLKDNLKNQWESWMIEEEVMQDRELSWRSLIDSGTTPPPKREQFSTWIFATLQSICTQTERNEWRHRRFGWFPEDMVEA